MNVAWGLVIIVSTSLAWGGQLLSWVAPDLAVRFGLADEPADTDRVFRLDARAEAMWDTFVLWTMPAAGVLLLAGHEWWRYFGLVGGGAYLYFAGRGIFVRVLMHRSGVAIGSSSSVRVAITALAIWGVVAIVTIGAATWSLEAT